MTTTFHGSRPQMTAHYFASKGRKYIVIADGPRPIGEEIEVSGKAEARKVAAARDAVAWNF